MNSYESHVYVGQLQTRPALAAGLDLAALSDRLAGQEGYVGNAWGYTPIAYSDHSEEIVPRIRERVRALNSLEGPGEGEKWLKKYNALLLTRGLETHRPLSPMNTATFSPSLPWLAGAPAPRWPHAPAPVPAPISGGFVDTREAPRARANREAGEIIVIDSPTRAAQRRTRPATARPAALCGDIVGVEPNGAIVRIARLAAIPLSTRPGSRIMGCVESFPAGESIARLAPIPLNT